MITSETLGKLMRRQHKYTSIGINIRNAGKRRVKKTEDGGGDSGKKK